MSGPGYGNWSFVHGLVMGSDIIDFDQHECPQSTLFNEHGVMCASLHVLHTLVGHRTGHRSL